MKGRFRYSLEPILLTRQWDLDALLRELSECNEKIEEAQKKLAFMQEKVKTAYLEWQALSNASNGLSVQRFIMHNDYLGNLLSQVKTQEKLISEFEIERDVLIDKVIAAQRAVEAIEQHREEMKAKFIKLRLSGEFKIADDQWNTIQAGINRHGS